MSRKLKSIPALIALAGSLYAFNAQAYTINDPYGSQYNSNDCSTDHCGGSGYDNAGINVSYFNHLLKISVFTNFSEPNNYGIKYGDLFLTVDGVKFVLDTSSAQSTGTGSLYQITSATQLRTATQEVGGIAGRPNQEVLYGSGGNLAGNFNFALAQTAVQPYELSYSIQNTVIGLTTGEHTLALLWAMSCGNDVVQGIVTDTFSQITNQSVPLPGTLALLLSGGLALFGMRSRIQSVAAV